MAEIDETIAVVDIGSCSAKVGFAGEDCPRIICPSTTNFEETRARRLTALEVNESSSERTHVVQRGFVPDSEHGVEQYINLLEHIFEHDLNLSLETVPVLLTEPPLNALTIREQIAEQLFEGLKVPALSLCTTSVLCLFAAGRTRGLVLENGASSMWSVPVFEGFSLGHAILRASVGGQDVTRYITNQLHQQGTYIEFDAVRELKEKLCRVSAKPILSVAAKKKERIPYELPDGTTIHVTAQLLEEGPELLFNPRANVLEALSSTAEALDGGAAAMVARSAAMCDADIANELLGAVVLAGGNTMTSGFSERMKSDLGRSVPESAALRIVPDPCRHESGYNAQRRHAAWIGGSMFASLSTFQSVRVTKQEWEDNGEKAIVHRKAL